MATGTSGPDHLINNHLLSSDVIDALAGDDSITIQQPSTTFLEPVEIVVYGGDGFDTMLATSAYIYAFDFTGFDGTIRLRSQGPEYIVHFDSIEWLTFGGRLTYASAAPLRSGDSRDHVSLSEAVHPIIYNSGGGDDIVHIIGNVPEATIDLGPGDDRLGLEYSLFPDEAPAPIVNGGDGADQIIGSAIGDRLYGDGGDDVIRADFGDDLVDGGAGADEMYGGHADDTYLVDDEGDLVIEYDEPGTDEVRTVLSTYRLTAHVENLTATSNVNHDFRGNSGNNVITGGSGSDLLRLYDGGDDTVIAGAGSDNIFFIGSLTSADIVNGGADVDTLILQGNYAGGLTLTANVTLIENISILGGGNTNFGEPGTNRYDYVLTTSNANFAAGVQARINAAALIEGEDFTFNGSAETDASFVVYGGRGKDTLTGGLGNDIFFLAEDRFASGDTVNGGSGYDGMFLRGNYTIDFTAPGYTGLFTSIENLTLTSATDERYARGGGTEFDYNITLSNALVGAGSVLTVSGTILGASETMILDGSLESDGVLRIFAGKASDTLKGGGQADILHGNLGADVLAGGGGADIFRYDSTAESTAASRDRILDFTPGTDRIDLGRIDARTNLAGDQAFIWIGSTAFSGNAGQLRAFQQGGEWILQGDVNGDGAADFTIALTLQGPVPLGAGDFIL